MAAAGAPPLGPPDDFPALYRGADRASLTAQHHFLLALRVRLGGLLLAAVGGVVTWQLGEVQLGGVVALVAFSAALGAELYGAMGRPERRWYEGRAAAESAKTLAWRYAVRGSSYDEVDDPTTDRRFLVDLREVLSGLDALEIGAGDHAGNQISGAMRGLRAADFPTRREAYLTGRLRDQQSWYARKAAWNARRGNLWLVASVAFEVVGVTGGALRAFGGVEVDLLGLFAALAATAAAWMQAKQYQNLATAYAVTAMELAAVATEAEALTDESLWGRFVADAEEAISREHTLWRASRGIKVATPHRPG